MNTRLTVVFSAYDKNGQDILNKLIFVDKDLSNAPPIEIFVEGLQSEILQDVKKESPSVASVVVNKIVIITTDCVAHTVWPKPAETSK